MTHPQPGITRTADIAVYLNDKASQLASHYVENGTRGYFERDGGELAAVCWFRLTRLDPVIRTMNTPVQALAYKVFVEIFANAYYASFGIPMPPLGGAE